MVARELTSICKALLEVDEANMVESALEMTVKVVRAIPPTIGRKITPFPRQKVGGFERLKRELFGIADTWANYEDGDGDGDSDGDGDGDGVFSPLLAKSEVCQGVILHGVSGVGKSVMARAMADNENLNFITAQA